MSPGKKKQVIKAVVLVDAPAGSSLPALEGALPLDRREALSGALLRRTGEWAKTLTGMEPSVVEIDGLAAATAGAETVVIVRPALVRLSLDHAHDVRDDLAHGCGLVVGPTLTGGWYLLALSPVNQDLIQAAGDGTSGTAGSLLAAAQNVSGLEVGLLGAERDLVRPADVKAAQADPLVDLEISRLIS